MGSEAEVRRDTLMHSQSNRLLKYCCRVSNYSAHDGIIILNYYNACQTMPNRIALLNKLISSTMASRQSLRRRKALESERSSTSGQPDQKQLTLPSSSREFLEIEEIEPTPIRRSFSKRRTISASRPAACRTQNIRPPQNKKDTQHPPEFINKFSNETEDLLLLNHTLKSNIVAEDPEDMLDIKQTLRSKILSGVNLSIISENKSESKLETPQQRNHFQIKPIDHHSKPNTFTKWANSRPQPVKKERSFSKAIELSSNSICEASIDPGLTSFHKDHTLNESRIKSMEFKDCFSKQSSKLPRINKFSCERPILQRTDSRQKLNKAAKKIMTIETLFAQKGVQLSSKLNDPVSIVKQHKIAEFFPQKQESVVRFEVSLDYED